MDTPLNIAVYEDSPRDAALLIQCILESGIPAEYEAFSSGDKLLASFSAGRYDLIFLDIYMGDIQQGVDIAAKIRETDTLVTLAFTTTSKEYALEGYRLKAYAYLEKPVQANDVREVLEQALNKRQNAPAVKLLISGDHWDIPLGSILYFEQKNQSVLVNTLTGTLRTSQTVKLKDIEQLLPVEFFRCHHSYIVNLRYVKGLDQELRMFLMQNGDKVYIRRQDMKKAEKSHEDYLFHRARGTKDEA